MLYWYVIFDSSVRTLLSISLTISTFQTYRLGKAIFNRWLDTPSVSDLLRWHAKSWRVISRYESCKICSISEVLVRYTRQTARCICSLLHRNITRLNWREAVFLKHIHHYRSYIYRLHTINNTIQKVFQRKIHCVLILHRHMATTKHEENSD